MRGVPFLLFVWWHHSAAYEPLQVSFLQQTRTTYFTCSAYPHHREGSLIEEARPHLLLVRIGCLQLLLNPQMSLQLHVLRLWPSTIRVLDPAGQIDQVGVLAAHSAAGMV